MSPGRVHVCNFSLLSLFHRPLATFRGRIGVSVAAAVAVFEAAVAAEAPTMAAGGTATWAGGAAILPQIAAPIDQESPQKPR